MLKSYSLVLAVLSVGVVQAAQGSCNDITQVKVRGVCCDKCPPGSFMAAWCDADSPTRCEACPQGTHNAEFNTLPRCVNCTDCNEAPSEVVVISQGVCPPGTYTDAAGSGCLSCTRCDREKYPCTTTGDAVCSGPDVSVDNTEFALRVAGGCSLIVVGAVVLIFSRLCHASVVKTDAPGLESGAGGDSPTLQHDQDNEVKAHLNPAEGGALSTWPSVSSVMESDIGDSVPLYHPTSKQ